MTINTENALSMGQELLAATDLSAQAELISATPVLVLAGGEGVRIKDITGGAIPKCLVELDDGISHLDQLLDGLEEQGFTNFIFCLGFLHEQITDHLEKRQLEKPLSQYRTSVEPVALGTGGAMHLAVEKACVEQPFLLVTSDAVFPYDELPGLRNDFVDKSVLWAVSDKSVSSMDQHKSLLYDPESGSIIQNIKRPWYQGANESFMPTEKNGLRVLVDGGHGIIDPEIFERMFKLTKRLNPQAEIICWYKDMVPMMAEITRRRVLRGRAPLLKGYVEEKPILDMGMMETHEYANQELQRSQGYFHEVHPSRLTPADHEQ